jgi:hypothetical protein
MTVSADDLFEVSVTISVTNKTTGEKTTETKHTDYGLDYGSMQAFRQVTIGAINEETGKLGQTLAKSFGQMDLGTFLSGALNKGQGGGQVR